MDEARQALEQLCVHYGIQPEYDDVAGRRHAAPDDTLIALLAQFDIDAGTPQRVAQARQAAEAAAWRQALPHVVALAAGSERWTLSLRLARWDEPLRWSVVEEGGARHEGRIDPAALSPAGEARLEGTAYREVRAELALPLPPGYHLLHIDGLPGETLLVAAPARCHQPPAVAAGMRVWGPAAQLYALRSERNWGIGDFGDLARLAEQWAERGAGIVGLNPLHALFTHNPAHASPYSPSSRLQLNTLYLDVEGSDDFRECEAAQQRVRSAAFQARLAGLRELPLVDYPGVAAAKEEIVDLLYAHFRECHLAGDTERARDFRAFQAEGGEALRRHAQFEVLQGTLHAGDPSVWGWPAWPGELRDPASPEVERFSRSHRERIERVEYLQWEAQRQLAAVSRRCSERGLAVGLYLDLAVSVDRGGSDAWSRQAQFAADASVGAPPDEFNPNGQGWGLPPLRPDRLRADGYRFFVQTLRASMRSAGALRIDHVMGLMRLFWIPPGKTAREGAYVHYDLDEMLAIVALESLRNRCMLIGEDLGTVADEVRAGLARIGVLSYRLLYFEREPRGGFLPAAEYPAQALVAVSTHDLPTLAGWWSGRDLRVRRELALYPDAAIYEKQLVDRAQDRLRLLLALQHAGLLPAGMEIDPAGTQALTPPLVEAVHAFLAATPSKVMMLQMEDALGVVDQSNLPSTTDEHPNWRRKLPLGLERMANDGALAALGRRIAALRPHPALRAPPAASTEARIPRATYRLQFHKDFDFDAARRIVPYLARLGISHVYCSPILRARPGSTHGYDIVAHDEINPELGGREGFDRFSAALREHGMGQLLDLVPNHMGVLGADNAWWMDVLENGQASAFARYFDIDWNPVDAELAGKVLVPVLGSHYGDALAGGDLRLAFEAANGAFALRYYEHRFPLDPRSGAALLDRAQARVGEASAAAALASLAAAFEHLPPRTDPEPRAVAERARDKEVHKSRLARLAADAPEVAQAIEAVVAELNAEPSRDALHRLLEAQAYRLAYWRVASDEINYRRFFDINDLAAVRMEEAQVFEATQGFALELAAAGIVDGLRIDHPDGLHDPAQYFCRLQEGFARRRGMVLPARDAAGRPARPLYVVAEKIAAPHEHVPDSWHVHGTTGYRFAMVVNGVLVDTAARSRFDRIWRGFSGEHAGFEELAYQGKRAIVRSSLASELTVLSAELLRIARAQRRTRDYTLIALRQALAEVAACMPVYRTYIVEQPSEQDRRYIDWAVAHARQRSRAADITIFDFVRRSLLAQAVEGAPAELAERVRRFAVRFQQFSAPVAAKGVEDTAFYRYHRLVSLNEVGGDPGVFGLTLRAFHGASADRGVHWPHTILATSTHDNKRSEDVRNRLNVLSEMPAAWRLALHRWQRLNRSQRTQVDAHGAPSAGDEYLLYQTLLGTVPAEGVDDSSLAPWRERIERYMLKAAREAKQHTSWIAPDEAYENALAGFVRGVLARVRPNPFLDDLCLQARGLAAFGALNSLSMALIKFSSPGVPDVYQGNELMDLSLVDPDNRRAVDYARRQALLDELEALAQQPPQERLPALSSLAATPHDGRAKLWVTWRLLQLRARHPELFRQGRYQALEATGPQAGHVIAYARQHEDTTLVVVAGRLFATLLRTPDTLPLGEAVWADTAVAVRLGEGTRLTNALSGETLTVADGRIRLAEAFARFPAAALLASAP